MAAVEGEQDALRERAGAHDHVAAGPRSHRVRSLKHGCVQRLQSNPVRRVLEAGCVQDEGEVAPGMIAAHWAEVAVAWRDSGEPYN